MEKIAVLLGVVLLAAPIPAQSDDNPLMDMAAAFLQNMGQGGSNNNGLAAIGSLVGSLMQGDNAKNLGALFGQNDNSNSGGDILSGLSSLLGDQNGKMDPSVIGSVISMVAQQMGDKNGDSEPQSRKKRSDNGLDGLLGLASSFFDNKNSGAILPLLVNAVSSMSNNEVEKRAHSHEGHADFLPPFLESVHVYWDVFINSELGQAIWIKSGLAKAMKAFTGPDGKLDVNLVFSNFENHSFRRHWIKKAAKYLTDTVVHLAKPDVYNRYIMSTQYVINGFLDSQGLPKSTHFNIDRPDESIIALGNHILKKYLNYNADVSPYVRPSVQYIKEILTLAKTAGQKLASRGDYHALADKITDTLNLEVIEPVLKVYRAYKHSLEAPHCQEHLMCLVNRKSTENKVSHTLPLQPARGSRSSRTQSTSRSLQYNLKTQEGLPGFKAALTKISSIAASAALSYQNGKGFWDLYSAIQRDVNCDAHYPADCSAFHEHELKVTTEVYHGEL